MTGVAHLRRLCHRLRAARLRWAGAAVARDARLAAGVRARPGMRDSRRGVITLGPECVCDEGVIFDAFGGRIEVGRNVFFGPYSIVYGHGGVAIGDDCLISMHCRILSSNHTVPPFGTPIRWQPDLLLPTRLGRDVWLGAGVTILGGVTVGDGCVIGAGSVVAKSLPPGAIAVGSPAGIKRFREGYPPAG